MNILVIFMSLIGKDPKENKYKISKICSKTKEVTGIQTNEAPTKCILHLLDENNEQLDKIIYIASKEVVNEKKEVNGENITTENYFVNCIKEYCKQHSLHEPKFEPVDASNDPNNIKEILKGLIEKIDTKQENDKHNIYIDITGGLRNSVNIIQLLIRFLEYSGHSYKLSLYSNITNDKSEVISCSETIEMLDILNGVNQFTTTGRSDILRDRCFNQNNNDKNFEEIKELMDTMGEFTDTIQLCKIENLDVILNKLKTNLERVGEIRDDIDKSSKIVLLRKMIPIIKNKFMVDSSDINYCKIIEWCLENGLLQQALTIYIEKIPKYIFSEKIIVAYEPKLNQVRNECRNNPVKNNLEAVLLYEKFLDCGQTDDAKKKTNQKKLYKKNENIYDKKIYTVENLNNIDFKLNDFEINVPCKKLQKVLYDYIIAKALRNQINHASENENLNRKQKEYFKALGYDIDSLNASKVSNILKNSIERIKNLKEKETKELVSVS